MESADDVRQSLAVAPLADLRRHEATSPEGESRVALLADARVLSWPLVVDAASGLILDGTHRAVVLAARDLRARFALIQRVSLDAPDVRIAAWCQVFEEVPADHCQSCES
jgi:hypothetical protein